jgi:gluconolactonase
MFCSATSATLVTGILLSLTGTLAVAEEAQKTEEVKANALRLEVPASWKKTPSRSRMRAAQFKVPPKDGEGEAAELVVFYFGGGNTGGAKANVERWIGQFQPEGRKVTLSSGEFKQGDYIVADISGTWKKPDGPPFARKTIDTPNSRVINVIAVVTEDGKRDHYFLKLSGPDKLVRSQADALRAALNVKKDSEKPVKVEDLKD